MSKLQDIERRMVVSVLDLTARLRTRLRHERGQTLVEYALILTFVSIVSVATLTLKIPGFLTTVFSDVTSKFP